MRAKRNDLEEETSADREIAFTWIVLAWVLILVILFWITSAPPSTASLAVQLSIRGNLGGGNASTHSEGERAEDAEILRASLPIPKVFDVARRMMGEGWADPKPFAMTATFAREDGEARLTMQVVFASAAARDQNVRAYASIEGGKQTLELMAEHLSGRLSAKTNGGVR
jgi:hypothetical protein